jgi:hypothetical protein
MRKLTPRTCDRVSAGVVLPSRAPLNVSEATLAAPSMS